MSATQVDDEVQVKDSVQLVELPGDYDVMKIVLIIVSSVLGLLVTVLSLIVLRLRRDVAAAHKAYIGDQQMMAKQLHALSSDIVFTEDRSADLP